VERLNETTAKGEGGDNEEIDDQRPLSPKSVGDETKDDLGQEIVRGVGGGQKRYRYSRLRQNGTIE